MKVLLSHHVLKEPKRTSTKTRGSSRKHPTASASKKRKADSTPTHLAKSESSNAKPFFVDEVEEEEADYDHAEVTPKGASTQGSSSKEEAIDEEIPLKEKPWRGKKI